MKAAEKERLMISLLAAVVMHICIIPILGLVDLYEDASITQTLGPVMVRLQEVRPRVLPEETAPEKPAPAESAPESTAPATQDRAAADRTASAPAPTNRASAGQATSRQSSAESTAPAFEWEAPKGEYRGLEGASSEGVRPPSSREPTERAVSRADEAPDYGEPIPETERRWSESSVIVEEQRGEDESARGEAESRTGAASSAPQSVLSEELRDQIRGISAAGSGEGTGETAGGRSGDTVGSSRAASDEGAAAAGKVPFSIEGIQNRDLLYYELPALTDREKSLLPASLEVAVSVILTPGGIPTDVHLTRGASTGHPEIDNKIVEAVRSWKFSALPAGSTGDVTGIIRIVLRAR